MFSLINFTSHSILMKKTPYEIFTIDVAKKFNIEKIRRDDVTLTPSLLK